LSAVEVEGSRIIVHGIAMYTMLNPVYPVIYGYSTNGSWVSITGILFMMVN